MLEGSLKRKESETPESSYQCPISSRHQRFIDLLIFVEVRCLALLRVKFSAIVIDCNGFLPSEPENSFSYHFIP